ncbi:MAG: hypothetical protein LUM44_12040 [Pyrinomonadaceae bacterium]|nr:hypothetical protein [Pyrinomonadaceae bacterium]
MKLKLFILLGILAFSINTFAQKTEPVKPAETKPETKPAPAVKLPTVKEILDKYVAAIGGKAANEKIKTRQVKGDIVLSPMGLKGTMEVYSAAPNKSYTKLNLGGIGEIIEAFDGVTAWTINPIQGNRDKEGEELLQTKLANSFYREVNLEKFYPKMEVKGIEKVGESDAYVVIATADGLPPETMYFNTKSGLLVRTDATSVTPEGKMATTNYYEDFRDIDGIKIPYKLRTVMPQFEILVTVTEVKNDVKVEDSLFAKPKQ